MAEAIWLQAPSSCPSVVWWLRRVAGLECREGSAAVHLASARRRDDGPSPAAYWRSSQLVLEVSFLRSAAVMSLHKLTAGDGYTYLTRQVAALDATERGHDGLGDYYAQRGESPGRWAGAGLTGLGGVVAGQPVGEEQMTSLFGQGRHPDAQALEREALAAGQTLAMARAARVPAQTAARSADEQPCELIRRRRSPLGVRRPPATRRRSGPRCADRAPVGPTGRSATTHTPPR